MRRLALVGAVLLAGCSSSSPETTTSSSSSTQRQQAVTFSACMRDNGVAAFPDPDASGELTIDSVVNGTSIDADGPAWKRALAVCKDLQPAGFTGRERNDDEQSAALRFAQCMRDEGIADFPDPEPGAPILDTTRIPSAKGRGALEIPGFTEAVEACRRPAEDAGVREP